MVLCFGFAAARFGGSGGVERVVRVQGVGLGCGVSSGNWLAGAADRFSWWV